MFSLLNVLYLDLCIGQVPEKMISRKGVNLRTSNSIDINWEISALFDGSWTTHCSRLVPKCEYN